MKENVLALSIRGLVRKFNKLYCSERRRSTLDNFGRNDVADLAFDLFLLRNASNFATKKVAY